MGSKPKAPKASAEEKAIIIRQSAELDKTMAENEKRLKAITRGKLGSKSLLGTAADAAKKEVGAGSYSPDRTLQALPSSGSGIFSRLKNRGVRKQNSKITYSGEKE